MGAARRLEDGQNVAERRQEPPGSEHASKLSLRLYVAGHSSNATLALRNLTRFCEIWLRGRYELRVIDVLKEPQAAVADSIVATPTLLKDRPPPVARIFGTLGEPDELAELLGIDAAMKAPSIAARPPRSETR